MLLLFCLDDAHLLSEPGCYNNDNVTNSHCGEEENKRQRAVSTPIPDAFKCIPYREDAHRFWEARIKKLVAESKPKAS